MTDGQDIDTELLYGSDEIGTARRLYAADHPEGPEWEDADRRLRGRYLERGGRAWLTDFARLNRPGYQEAWRP